MATYSSGQKSGDTGVSVTGFKSSFSTMWSREGDNLPNLHFHSCKMVE